MEKVVGTLLGLERELGAEGNSLRHDGCVRLQPRSQRAGLRARENPSGATNTSLTVQCKPARLSDLHKAASDSEDQLLDRLSTSLTPFAGALKRKWFATAWSNFLDRTGSRRDHNVWTLKAQAWKGMYKQTGDCRAESALKRAPSGVIQYVVKPPSSLEERVGVRGRAWLSRPARAGPRLRRPGSCGPRLTRNVR